MSDYRHKDDTGSLFGNDRREKETQPHAKGSAMIGGVEYWLSAWTNTTNDGRKYQSIKFERKDASNQSTQIAPAPEPIADVWPRVNDEIPF